MEADELQVGVAVVGLEEGFDAPDVYAELGFGLAGGGVLVGEGIDVWVDAEGGAGADVEILGEGGDGAELLLGLDVEEEDGVGVGGVGGVVLVLGTTLAQSGQGSGTIGRGTDGSTRFIVGGAAEGGDDFFVGLADAGVDDLVGRDAGEAGAAEFAAGDDVETCAEIDEGFEDGKVGTGLDGEADERIEGGEGRGEALVVEAECGGGVDVDGGFDAGGDGGEVEAFAGEAAVLVDEVVHDGGG